MTARLFLFMLLVGLYVPGFAQPAKPPGRSPQYPIANQFEHLSVADGLSNNSVNCMVQDRQGYMWFGTHEGLNRYDGITFTVFRPDPRHPTRSFQNSIVTGLCEGDDQVWAITEGGLHEIDTKTGLVTPHLIRTNKANRWNNQISIHKDSLNQLWISTFAGLARYSPSRHHFTLYPSPNAESPVITTFEDRQHRLWVGTLQGIYLLNPATGRFVPVPVAGVTGPQPTVNSFYQDSQNRLWMGTASEGYSLLRLDLNRQPWRAERYNPGGQHNPYVWRNTIHQDSTGLMWVGTSNGLQALDPLSGQVVTYRTEVNLLKSLGSSNAQTVYHDRAGTLWVGTDNGVDRQSANTKPFQTYRVLPNERMANRPENRVNTLASDGRGQLWFSNQVTVYQQGAGQQQPNSIPPDRLGSVGGHINYINTIVPDGLGGMWFGTQDGLYHADQVTGQYTGYPSQFPVQYISVKSISNVPTDDLWVGGVGGIASFNRRTHVFRYYTGKQGTANGLPDKQVNGLLASQDWNVWVLIRQLGLCRMNPRTGVFTRFVAGPRGQLSTNDVESIYEDKAGTVWVGTHLGGLNRFNPRTGLFSVITQADGIPGNSILGITGDDSGQLWLSTDKGLCRFDPTTKAVHTYEVADGLPSNHFIQNAVFRQQNELFFGSQNGYVRFNPSRILDDTRPFPVYINALTVLDKPRPLTDSLVRLRHDESMVSFGFAALAYEQPGQNQYAYQLVGVNPDWVQNGNRHVANFTNLAPGNYTFRVKAANSNGFWSPSIAYVRVIVSPPWWATWWAYILYALLAAGAIWAYIRFYTNRIRQQQELVLNRQQAEQLKALDELKTRFFSNITHEFRTPLALIIGPVEKLLQENRFDRPMLTTVHRNADQLLRLINQLLDLSKLEGNYMAVSLMQGSVPDFIHQAVAAFERAAEQKGVTLTCEVTGFPPHDYVFDADKWEKILSNLLSNALKFSDAGGHIMLTTLPTQRGNELTGVQILLVDSGIGIAPDKLPHIFDRFYQADTSSTRAYEGTGIGLALVHELVGLLGGTIEVESELGVGTTFRLMLPVQSIMDAADVPRLNWAGTRQAFVAPLTVSTSASTSNRSIDNQSVTRILIVEDNDELRAFLVGELGIAYYVLEAADGEAGWAIVQTELPDIVLTDLMMPRMDGYELTRRIKNHPDTDHIAVVMLTAKAAQQSRLDGLQQGADEYLAKPFSIDELHLRLHNLINRQQKLGEHYRQQFALSTEPLDSVPPDPFLLRIYGLLDSHIDNSALSVDWLAGQLAMTRKTLYRKVQTLIQLPPADLIRQYRLRKATDLLRAGRSVSETADLVGFSTPSHFSLVFKEFYQQTPSEFMTNRAKGV
ncbi:response regulator [Fibrella sp. HMF5335]|uniref:histidine kinase n=1 Tax=Fibrella rubiginis TaxID=2817060 RepID=A0A939K4U4_9BACT|nr:two-component regulator propeller domain-containing protein [Fibrella rubiginis]MBO0935755.1 response regulator [Fibrella rubiginis]